MTDEDILEALESSLRTGDPVHPIVGTFYALAEKADAETRNSMLRSLDPCLRSYPLDRIGGTVGSSARFERMICR
jgi:hypothetical protein